MSLTKAQLETLLITSSKEGKLDGVKYALGEGVYVDVRDHDQRTPLHHACELGKIDVIKCLIDAGADVNAKDGDGNTPLHHACFGYYINNNIDVIKCLIDAGADLKAKNKYGNTPLHRACDCHNTNVNVIKCLIDAGADLKAKNKYGNTPLDLASDAQIKGFIRSREAGVHSIRSSDTESKAKDLIKEIQSKLDELKLKLNL